VTAFIYKVKHDGGTAPCVEDGLLSLAICKPAIRRNAKLGDILIGIGGRKIGMGRLIYAAYVDEVIPASPTYYQPKGPYFHRRDCVYCNVKGEPKHRGPSFSHYKQNAKKFFKKDVGVHFVNARVLLSRNFVYLGKEGTAETLIARKALHPAITWTRQHWLLDEQKTPAEFDALSDMLHDIWTEKDKNYTSEPSHPFYADKLAEWRKKNSRRPRQHNKDVRKRLAGTSMNQPIIKPHRQS
jgi:Nucleotide modification associated domain 2